MLSFSSSFKFFIKPLYASLDELIAIDSETIKSWFLPLMGFDWQETKKMKILEKKKRFLKFFLTVNISNGYVLELLKSNNSSDRQVFFDLIILNVHIYSVYKGNSLKQTLNF